MHFLRPEGLKDPDRYLTKFASRDKKSQMLSNCPPSLQIPFWQLFEQHECCVAFVHEKPKSWQEQCPDAQTSEQHPVPQASP